jgi:hypothetical protein
VRKKQAVATILLTSSGFIASTLEAFGVPAPLPSMSGPLTANPNPLAIEAGSIGTLDLTGAISGLAFGQTNAAPADRSAAADIGNAQLFLQSTTGWLQFFVQLGAYTLPSLGTPYVNPNRTANQTYGFVPEAYLKVTPSDEISVEFGKLPSLIGLESTFTFENANIERGLLWNQTSSVSSGIQVNYNQGQWNASISWNDGYYSGRYNWVTALVAYALDGTQTLTFVAGANLGHTGYSSFATPLAQNNGAVADLAYSGTLGGWTFTPYVQFSRAPADNRSGLHSGGSAFGAALLASYRLSDDWSMAVRTEKLITAGNLNLLYGAGSSAWSTTLTPAYQEGVFFARAEASYVGIENGKNGLALGRSLDEKSQARLMLETGVLF